jgi:hypothetical protein
MYNITAHDIVCVYGLVLTLHIKQDGACCYIVVMLYCCFVVLSSRVLSC